MTIFVKGHISEGIGNFRGSLEYLILNLFGYFILLINKRRKNMLHWIKFLKLFLGSEPAPPKSLFAVNKTQTSVTLLWVEEGVADFFEVFCQQMGSSQETKLQVPYMLIFFYWVIFDQGWLSEQNNNL